MRSSKSIFGGRGFYGFNPVGIRPGAKHAKTKPAMARISERRGCPATRAARGNGRFPRGIRHTARSTASISGNT